MADAPSSSQGDFQPKWENPEIAAITKKEQNQANSCLAQLLFKTPVLTRNPAGFHPRALTVRITAPGGVWDSPRPEDKSSAHTLAPPPYPPEALTLFTLSEPQRHL